MSIAHEFKTPINSTHDTHKKSVYRIDDLIAAATGLDDSIKNELNNYDTLTLSELIKDVECLDFVSVTTNSKERTSTCNFSNETISFSKNHINKPIVAIHEFAHFIDDLFSAIQLPAHHISFLSAYEYLINKIILKNANANVFSDVINQHNEHPYTNRKTPYVKDYYTVFDINEAEYLSLLSKHADKEPLRYNFRSNKSFHYGKFNNFEKTGFDNGDHYLNLIKIGDGKRYIKVIVKKLGFEVKKEKTKEYQLTISPISIYADNYYGTTHRVTSSFHADYNGILMNGKNKDEVELIYDLITKTSVRNSLPVKNCDVYISRENNIFILFDYYVFSKSEVKSFISNFKKALKQKRVSYYQSKSIDEFSQLTDTFLYVL